MGDTGQTPGAYVLAGGSGFFSPECVAALAQCGLHPDDFGSYDHVKERIRAAKAKDAAHKAAKKRGDPNPPPAADAHDRLLIKSQAGHARQNAIFQGKRGDACQNAAGADGYHAELAPSMPHLGKAEMEGTTHWGVSNHDDELRQGGAAPPGTPLSADQIKEHSPKGSLIGARGADPETLADRGRGPKTVSNNETKLRKESAAVLDPANAARPDSPESETISDGDAEKATECIEQFVEAAFAQMQAKVMQDYGPDYEKTKDRLATAEADALARKTAAKERLDKAYKEKDWAAFREASVDHNQACQDHDLARNANASAHCMRDQALRMAAQEQPLPPMSGSVPRGSNIPRGQRPPKPSGKKSRGTV